LIFAVVLPIISFLVFTITKAVVSTIHQSILSGSTTLATTGSISSHQQEAYYQSLKARLHQHDEEETTV
jgi:hypothetical protein